MIIFNKQFRKAEMGMGSADEGLKVLLDEAESLIERAAQGVKSDRAPLTIVEKVQLADSLKLVKKLIIDINKDISKNRPVDKNREKLEKAVIILRTSIENIL